MLVSAYLCRIPVSVEPKSPTLFSLRGILSRVIKTDILVRAAVSYFNFSRFYPLFANPSLVMMSATLRSLMKTSASMRP